MFRKILVPLDGSHFAERALPLALAIAERTSADLQLVSAVPTLPAVTPAVDDEGPVRGWFEEEQGRATEYLEKVSARLAGATTDARIHTRVLSGDPAQVLDERIRKTGVELVVMTTHGRGPFQRAWLGSVADGLIRRAPCPLLLHRPDEAEGGEELGEVDLRIRPEFLRILVPLDGSSESEAVVPGAAAMARLFGARVTLVTVVSDPFRLGSTYLPHAAQENTERERMVAEARAELERTATGAAFEGIDVDFEVVMEDDPGSGVLAYRSQIDAHMVAMSTRGRGGVARLVLGSVADKVIRGGKVPVFLHRAPDREDERVG